MFAVVVHKKRANVKINLRNCDFYFWCFRENQEWMIHGESIESNATTNIWYNIEDVII